MRYTIEDTPLLRISALLGFQHYFTMFGSTVAIPLILQEHLKASNAELVLLISTMFFVSGICMLLQTTFGSRLPIVQGGTFSFIAPAITICGMASLKDAGFDVRMQHVQGAIICGAVVEMVIGVYICYDRHFPEGARALALNGAEAIFNPSATVVGLSEYLWSSNNRPTVSPTASLSARSTGSEWNNRGASANSTGSPAFAIRVVNSSPKLPATRTHSSSPISISKKSARCVTLGNSFAIGGRKAMAIWLRPQFSNQ